MSRTDEETSATSRQAKMRAPAFMRPAVRCRRASATAQISAPVARVNLLGIGKDQLAHMFTALGKPAYRGAQVWEALYRSNAACFNAITTLGKADRHTLSQEFVIDNGAVLSERISSDGTRKWVVRLPAPHAPSDSVECVYIPLSEADPEVGEGRASHSLAAPPASSVPHGSGSIAGTGTLCVSSQVGCSLACSFCHTGTQRMEGNVSAGGIVAQYLQAATRLSGTAAASHSSRRISNIVFMGQGEPLYNWRQVHGAIRILTDADGIALSERRITISTAGVAPAIPRIAQELPGVRLAISLHAPNNELRSRLMGINDTYPLEQLMAACATFLATKLRHLEAGRERSGHVGGASGSETQAPVAALTLRQLHRLHASVADRHSSRDRARITFEYVMLDGVNDSPAHAQQLLHLLSLYLPPEACHVNLLPFHPWPGAAYRPSSEERILRFQDALQRGLRSSNAGASAPGVLCHIRRSRGLDILGACGQLKSSEAAKPSKLRPLE